MAKTAKKAEKAARVNAKGTKAKKSDAPERSSQTPAVESLSARTGRAVRITKGLRELYPEAECSLRYESALHLLVSTILAAQCTDKRVNMITPALFKRYKTAKAFAIAEPAELEEMIRSSGFFRNKAKNIIGAARAIVEEYSGRVPDTMEDLTSLPGVARKTANVVLGTWFKKNDGFVVDTHIGRLAHRLGLSWRSRDSKDAIRIETDLMEVFCREDWAFVGHALVWHGRKVCSSRKPKCAECGIAGLCPSACELVEPNAERSKRTRRKRSKPDAGQGKATAGGKNE